jgi:hypothetical protein
MVKAKREVTYPPHFPDGCRPHLIEGHLVVDVTLPPEALDKARDKAEKGVTECKEKNVRGRIDEKGFNRFEDAENGAQAELAVALDMRDKWEQALQFWDNTFGKNDNVFRDFTISVKNRRQDAHINIDSYMFVPVDQTPCELYVGCSKLPANVVRIWGWCTREELVRNKPKRFEHDVLDFYIPFRKLHPISEMLDLWKPGV